MATRQTEYQIELFLSRVRRIQSELQDLEYLGFSVDNLQSNSATYDILQSFPDELLKESSEMSECYQILFCFENDVRKVVGDVMKDKFGSDWWDQKVRSGTKTEVKGRQEAEKNSVFFARIDDPLYFTTLGELKEIISDNFEYFTNHFRSRKFVEELLFQINRLRIVVGHSCMLEELDVTTLKQNIERWYKVK
ncbi:MAG: hypothetical protein KC483_04745 [Nitrosarchaeum sp.]|nr:hypothetical protein [Nitrosarchaeum sp.]